ncbi:Pentatricopeptide repeat (PPR) superfamily protein [Arabidopsis thaliana]|uniref:Pentatricopeptide repeat (PPR) superfamily protein n=1 Tax=Arabidopsis thaliana TaxID=3702 RepID=F4I8W7_ARATH|nr:Pentatricopeptide repeat (PPR) superfamily protein [Arabidopsis thaliana]AEE28740.1 Pentatricopeptide repeat (PPR) superfamily protein [Arabidopsis thaliana]|eukprot:NP_172614.1 Pentatricopeptide repeat (PPR) superfamily protein [Arabidopsis thaliana]
MAPFSSSSAEIKIARTAPFSSSAENKGNRQINGASSSASSCDAENAKSGGSRQLGKAAYMEGKHVDALQIFMWMHRKEMSFSTSEVALFVDIIGNTIGIAAAHSYLKKVDPNCDQMHNRTENWPAFVSLVKLETKLLKENGIVHATRPPK